jgi:N-acetylglucosaminyldiphosphoundecaprenol N-acetyl-beta-D-mannosaminyltransferase
LRSCNFELEGRTLSDIDRVFVLGIPIQAHSMSSLLDILEREIRRPGCATAYAVCAHTLCLTRRFPELLRALREADIVHADGASLILASRLLNRRLPERLWTGDVWTAFCELACCRKYQLFLLGGEEGLAERAKDQILVQHPDLTIVGVHHGYFDLMDERVVAMINDLCPDVLWVGMGDPRQILWVEQVKHRLRAGLAITCGGLFKLLAGELKHPPRAWQKAGFGWLYRVFQEPELWRRYATDLPLLAVSVLAQRFWGYRENLSDLVHPE